MITTPWLAEIGLISWRTVRQEQRPPLPSELLATFVVFGGASLVAVKAPRVAAVFGWGVVVATALNFFPLTPKSTSSRGADGKPTSIPTKRGETS